MGYDIRRAKTKEELIDKFLSRFNYHDNASRFSMYKETVAHQLVDNVLWYVITYEANGIVDSLIVYAALEEDPEEGWKAYTKYERDFPPNCSCPLGFLDMAPTTEPRWRARVIAYHHNK